MRFLERLIAYAVACELWIPHRDLSTAHDRRIGAQRIAALRGAIGLEQIRHDVEIFLVLEPAGIVHRHGAANERVEIAHAPVVPRLDERRADEAIRWMTGRARLVEDFLTARGLRRPI